MKTVKLHGYFAQNLGDDLMIDILLRRYPQCRFYCEEENSFSESFRDHHNFVTKGQLYQKYGRLNHLLNILTGYRKRDFFFQRLFERMERKCSCGVYIGGSIYMEQSTVAVADRIRWEEKKLANGPLFVIGANFGPCHTDAFREEFDRYFRKCGGVCFRDRASYALFRDLPNVSYAPDVVFNLEPGAVENTGTVLISVIDVNRKEDLTARAQQYESRIREICTECVCGGKKPVLMSFCAAEGDEDALERIFTALPEAVRNQTAAFRYRGNLKEALALFARADSVIATRFHAMILALCYAKPFFSISYSQKVTHVLEDLGSEAFCDLKDIQKISASDILARRESPRKIQSYIRRAAAQFDQFDRYISNV